MKKIVQLVHSRWKKTIFFHQGKENFIVFPQSILPQKIPKNLHPIFKIGPEFRIIKDFVLTSGLFDFINFSIFETKKKQTKFSKNIFLKHFLNFFILREINSPSKSKYWV